MYFRQGEPNNPFTDKWYSFAHKSDMDRFINASGNTPAHTGTLNNLLEPGFYYCTGMTDPPGASTYGYVLVMRQNEYSVKQVYFGYHNNYIFVRYSTSGEWAAWTEVNVSYAPGQTLTMSKAIGYGYVTGSHKNLYVLVPMTKTPYGNVVSV